MNKNGRDFQRKNMYKAEVKAWGSYALIALTRKTELYGPAVVRPLNKSVGKRGSWSGTLLPNGHVAWRKSRTKETWEPHALPTVAECQAFVNMVCADLGVPTHRVTDGRRRKSAAACYDGTIALPRWARTRPVILHELAHHLRPHPSPAHGAEFCRTLVDLVAQFIGWRQAQRLEWCLLDGGCQVSEARATLQETEG